MSKEESSYGPKEESYDSKEEVLIIDEEMDQMEEVLIMEEVHIPSGSIQLGLCCLNTELRDKNIFCSRTVTRANFTVEKAKQLALQNLRDAATMMEWNAQHHIYHFRLSSDIFPHYTDDETEPYTMDFAQEELTRLGQLAKKLNQRITMHPGQFNQIGTPTASVFQKTIADLSMHAEILDRMDTDPSESILCIHGGGVYGNKKKTIERWISQFQTLPEPVRRRVAIECCEKCYSIEDCLEIAKACSIPMILDTHHDQCYRKLHPTERIKPIEEYIPDVLATWKGVAIFHISEQRPDARVGAHSDFIKEIPHYLLEIPEKYGRKIAIEVEAKMKEQAIQQLYKTYPELVY